MDVTEKEVKRKLIAKRKIVKQKLDLLKQGEILHEDIFSPITKHLKSIETKLGSAKQQKTTNETTSTTPGKVKEKKDILSDSTVLDLPGEEQVEEEERDFTTPLPLRGKRRRLHFQSTPLKDEDDDEPGGLKRSIIEEAAENESDDTPRLQTSFQQTRNQKIMEESFQDYLEQYEPLPRKYIKNMITDTDNKFDHRYGVVFNSETEKFYIGDSELKIVESDIVVQSKRYKGTAGLYELLFKKYPVEFSVQDEKNYVEIIRKTNAHRRYYKSSEQVQGSILPKYKRIIAPALRYKLGRGVSEHIIPKRKNLLMQYSSKPVEYVHWDNPNELVDRLRLLLSSQSAGNTSVTNEINSIIEELREANIIE